ncbi:integrase, partial [Bacillus anthracis]
MITTMNFPTSPFYEELTGKVDENILRLRDSRGVFLLDKVDELPIKYFLNQCLDTPWQNQLLLAMLIGRDRNLDARTVYDNIRHINVRIKDIFHVYDLKTFIDFDTEQHMYD